MMSGLLLRKVLSVCTCWFLDMVTLLSWLVSTNFGSFSYQGSNFTPTSLHMVKCSWAAHTLSCLCIYCSFAGTGHADILWSTASSNCWHSLYLISISIIIIIIIIISGSSSSSSSSSSSNSSSSSGSSGRCAYNYTACATNTWRF